MTFSCRCRVPGLPNDTFEIQNDYHKYLINLSIPLKADGDYEQCLVVKNGSLEKCTDWVYDRSMFTNTVNSQVDNCLQIKDKVSSWSIVLKKVSIYKNVL